MKFETKTGIGYYEDSQGRVVDYYDLPVGGHTAEAPRIRAVDVENQNELPDIEQFYKSI